MSSRCWTKRRVFMCHRYHHLFISPCCAFFFSFFSKVRMINPGVANGYDSCDALKDDITNALKHYANMVIVSEKSNNLYAKCDPSDPNWNPWGLDDGVIYEGNEEMTSSAPIPEDASISFDSAPAGGAESSSKVQEDSFGTNNQVEGVDEADIVKSDGNYVYAGYGDILYVWNATDGSTGMSVTRMPYNDTKEEDCEVPPWGPMPIDVVILEDGMNSTEEVSVEATDMSSEAVTSTGSASSSNGGRKARSHQHRRASMPFFYDPCYKPKPRILSLLLQGTRLTAIVSEEQMLWRGLTEDTKPSIINDYSSLTIRVYDTSSVPTDGSSLTLLGERKIKGNYNAARSIDNTGIVVTTSYVDTYLFANDLYRYQFAYCGLNDTEYEQKASEIALNKTESFMEQLVDELDLEIGCSNTFQIAAMQSGESNKDGSNGDLLSQFVQVLSFDASADFVDNEIEVERAGAFAGGYLSSVYVARDFVAALNVGSTFVPSTSSWDQSTFVLGFNISSPVPRPFCYAEVSGQPINEYAADLYEDHLRIATTEWHWSVQGSDRDSMSITTSKIFVLSFPEVNDTAMVLAGVTDHLGKENESIFAVRFIGDKGYVVTFEQTDPFLIVELSDPTDPHVVGELEIPGFSSYLHPIEIDGTSLMLGIGQSVNATTGWSEGVKISLFDISNPENPVEKTHLVDKNAYSNAQNDFKSFRYLPQSQKLILPKSEYTWTSEGNFDGFVVYNVSADAITQSYEISHALSSDIFNGCWYDAYMPPRSLVFQSKATTILSHSVISTDLETGAEEWRVNLDEGLNKTNTTCWGYFMGY
eukprot:scaffold32_cov190-Alexandrium_tamarense.AAC.16